MRQVTVTLTDEHAAAIEAFVASENANLSDFNARVAAELPDVKGAALRPPDTLEAVIQRRVEERLADDLRWHEQHQIDTLVEQYRALPDADRQGVKAQIEALVKGAKT